MSYDILVLQTLERHDDEIFLRRMGESEISLVRCIAGESYSFVVPVHG